ncbi:MAG TPA: hypothetical protein VMT85_01910 [Thermoanaerobaculia bacterium]|nr:hypothetical protein [Thermoanaerobaculia bacterium]
MNDRRIGSSRTAASRPVGLLAGIMLGALWVLGASTLGAGQQQPADDTTFREEIAVTEVRVAVSFPGLAEGAARDLTDEDLVVVEDGLQREVTRIALVSAEASPWTVLVYFDEVLAEPAMLPLVARTLSENATALTRLGPVRAVWAGPSWAEHREVLRSTSNATEVTQALADLAREAANDLSERRQGAVASGPGAFPPSVLRRRADRLIVETAGGCPAGPCLLVLVSAGYFPAGGEAEADPIAVELAKVLAGYGWNVVSLPLDEPEPVEIELGRPGAGTDFEAWKEETGGVVVRGSRARRVEDADAQELDDAVDPELAPLQLWAAASVGEVIRSPQHVEPMLRSLRNRWWVYFRTQRARVGELRPLQVRFSQLSSFEATRQSAAAAGLVDPLGAVRSPRWIRSAMPVEVTDARLRSILDGANLYGDFYVAGARTGDEAISWETPLEETLLVRLTAARAGDDEASERLVEVEPVDGKASVEVLPEERGGVLIVDEVETGRWGPAMFGGDR